MIAEFFPTLCKRLSDKSCLAAPGIYDAFSARIVERLGFEALYLGGNALGMHLGVGQPFVTLTETISVVQAVRRVSRLPFIVDAGAGFGDAAHAAQAMRALIGAGADAVHIDDQIYPKRAHYHRGKGRLAESDIVCGKLSAMAAVRDGRSQLLIARTDSLRVTRSIESTIARCRDYLGAGADALMVLDLGPDQIGAFKLAFPDVPLFWIAGPVEGMPLRIDLAKAGFAVAIYPFSTVGAVHEAIFDTWSCYAESGQPRPFGRPAADVVTDALNVIDLDDALRIERATTESTRV